MYKISKWNSTDAQTHTIVTNDSIIRVLSGWMVEFPVCRSLSVDVSPDGWMDGWIDVGVSGEYDEWKSSIIITFTGVTSSPPKQTTHTGRQWAMAGLPQFCCRCRKTRLRHSDKGIRNKGGGRERETALQVAWRKLNHKPFWHQNPQTLTILEQMS